MAFTYFKRYTFLQFILHTSNTYTWALLFLDGELAFLLIHSSEDTFSGHSFTESELAWFLLYTLLVTQTVTCLVSGGELAWFQCALFWWHRCGLPCFRMWVGLAFNVHCSGDTDVACFVSVCELAWFIMCALPILIFIVHSSGDTDYDLSCFRGWVGLVSMCTLLVTQMWPP